MVLAWQNLPTPAVVAVCWSVVAMRIQVKGVYAAGWTAATRRVAAGRRKHGARPPVRVRRPAFADSGPRRRPAPTGGIWKNSEGTWLTPTRAGWRRSLFLARAALGRALDAHPPSQMRCSRRRYARARGRGCRGWLAVTDGLCAPSAPCVQISKYGLNQWARIRRAQGPGVPAGACLVGCP